MKKVTIIAVALILLIAISVFIAIELHPTVTFDIDGDEQTITVWAWTVGDALTAAGIPISEGDIVTPPVNERLPDEGQVNIERAFWVNITADGESQSLWTTEHQPEILLEMAAVELGPADLLLWNGIPYLVR